MSSLAVARRYATALADVVGSSAEVQGIQQELKSWEEMISSSDLLKELLVNPTIEYEQKRKALNEMISRTRVRPTTANFLKVLLRNHRLIELPLINDQFARVLDQRAGLVSAQVISARPIAEDTKESIDIRLREITGQDVRVSYATDDALIGGMVTKIGSTVYDGSVRNQLEELGKQLAGS